MGKRASVTPAASPAKRKSVGKVAASPAGKSPAGKSPGGKSPAKVAAQPPGPLDEVLKVIKATADAATTETLASTLPLAIKVSDGGEPRHEFQEKILDAAAKLLSVAVASQQEAVSALEKEATSLEEENGQSGAVAADIAASLVDMQKDCKAAEEALKSQQDALKDAQDALEVAKRRVAEADGDLESQKGHVADFEAGLADLWQPLKASEIPGMKWRDRDRKLSQLVVKFQAIGVEESLLAAVQTALKMKVDTRGEFAQAAVTCAEEAYRKYVDTKKEGIDAFGSEISARTTAATEAETGVTVAQAAADAKQQESFDAQNTWAAMSTREIQHKRQMEIYEPTTRALQNQLAVAKAKLLHLEGVSGGFESLRSGKPSAAEEAEAAAAAAAAAALEPVATEAVAGEPDESAS